MEDTERYFQRLRRPNRGLDTGHWRFCEHRGETNGIRFEHSIVSDCRSAGEDGVANLQWHGTPVGTGKRTLNGHVGPSCCREIVRRGLVVD